MAESLFGFHGPTALSTQALGVADGTSAPGRRPAIPQAGTPTLPQAGRLRHP